MININMSDVISVLSSCRPYLIVLGIILVIAIAVMIVCMKCKKELKKLIRKETGIAMILAVVITANLICFGPMSTLLTLSFGGSGTISDDITDLSNGDCRRIADEGIVLLENEGILPLQPDSAVNVFGWGSIDPVYGGSGAGALNDLYDRVTLIEGLENAGFSVNEELVDFYDSYGMERAAYGTDWSLPEPAVETYNDEMLNNAVEFSDKAIIVISRVGGEGSDLPTDMSTASYTNNSEKYADFEDGESYLELSRTEEDLIEMVCSKFDNVIVVYNGLTTMELGFVEQYPQIKGVLWCSGPGQTGFDSLGKILNGEVNPSGKTPDTFVYDLTMTPWWNNIGNFAYDNMDEFMVDESDPYMGGAVPTFVNYVEGIYVGYRFYETAAAEGLIDYESTVQYPFGYGLSYTEFEKSISDMSNDNNGTITIDVTVTNTGDTAGKDVVEIYYNPPYRNGGIEKASANLLAFDKTDMLQPGESQVLSLQISEEDMASYDAEENGCYVLEAGDYIISLNSDSHHVLDSFTYTVDSDIIYGSDNARSSDKTAAVNQFDFAKGEGVIYLSRDDHFANYDDAVAAPTSYSMPESEKEGFINTSTYQEEDGSDQEMPVTGADNGMTLAELRGKDFNDPSWDTLLDQLTIDEMQDMIAHGGFQTASVDRVGKVSTVDCDGPSAVSNNFTKAGSVGFPSAIMIASTWNEELAEVYGSDMGLMAGELGASGWYAPSMNLHRTAFGGRNYEYFSEDGFLSGKMAMNAVKGADNQGVYAYLKHFALNEQETNRWSMICTWIQEQPMRELYLKPFEMCVKEGGASAVMSSFNYIGNVWAGGCRELLTTVLRDEWGFEGFVDTDYFAGAYYMNADQMISSGGDTCLSTFDIGTNFVTYTDNPIYVQYMKDACHNIMYTVVNSRAYDTENLETGMESWMKTVIAADVCIGIIILLLEVQAVRRYCMKRKENL